MYLIVNMLGIVFSIYLFALPRVVLGTEFKSDVYPSYEVIISDSEIKFVLEIF